MSFVEILALFIFIGLLTLVPSYSDDDMGKVKLKVNENKDDPCIQFWNSKIDYWEPLYLWDERNSRRRKSFRRLEGSLVREYIGPGRKKEYDLGKVEKFLRENNITLEKEIRNLIENYQKQEDKNFEMLMDYLKITNQYGEELEFVKIGENQFKFSAPKYTRVLYLNEENSIISHLDPPGGPMIGINEHLSENIVITEIKEAGPESLDFIIITETI